MVKIFFGPSGIGGVNNAVATLERYKKDGLNAAEVEFTHGIYMKKNKDAIAIGQAAKKIGIVLSIHAPYYVNLNSMDPNVVKASKKRILDCCEKAHYLGAKFVVFHAAYYTGSKPEECYDEVKRAIKEMHRVIKQKKWKVYLCPETTGSKTQFGSLDEVLKLQKETGCFFCVDFAHLLARPGDIDYNLNYDKVFLKLKKFPHLHCHFSGIDFGDKGEKKHILTPEKEIKKLLAAIKKNKVNSLTIINESPSPVHDSIKTLMIAKSMKI